MTRRDASRRGGGGSAGWGWLRPALFLIVLVGQRGETDGKTINAYIETSLRQFSDIYLGQVHAPRLPASGGPSRARQLGPCGPSHARQRRRQLVCTPRLHAAATCAARASVLVLPSVTRVRRQFTFDKDGGQIKVKTAANVRGQRFLFFDGRWDQHVRTLAAADALRLAAGAWGGRRCAPGQHGTDARRARA